MITCDSKNRWNLRDVISISLRGNDTCCVPGCNFCQRHLWCSVLGWWWNLRQNNEQAPFLLCGKTFHYRPQGKVMFSEAFVCPPVGAGRHSSEQRPPPRYWHLVQATAAVDMHPTGMHSCYRPQGKVMFSQVSVILSTIGLMPTQSLLILVGYSVTCCDVGGRHPTGMLSCSICIYLVNQAYKKRKLVMKRCEWVLNQCFNCFYILSLV